MWTLPEFESCDQVGPDLVEQCFEEGLDPHPAQRVLRLLERMARVAKPAAGAERILAVLARLAKSDWIGGRLELTLSDFGVATEVDVRVDDGRGPMRWRSFSVAVPFSELSAWVKTWPSEIRPLAPFGEPVPERLSLRAQASSAPPQPSGTSPEAKLEPLPAAPTSKRPGGDRHRRATVRLENVRLPSDAFPKPEPPKHEERDTARPPPPVPAVQSTAEPDATDDGWD
jgi:hypothetical protein